MMKDAVVVRQAFDQWRLRVIKRCNRCHIN